MPTFNPERILSPADNGTRIRTQGLGADGGLIITVGDDTVTWPVGTFIEIVRLSTELPVDFQTISPPGACTLNYLSGGRFSLNVGEYGRVSLVDPGTAPTIKFGEVGFLPSVWDLHIYPVVQPAGLQMNVFKVQGADGTFDGTMLVNWDQTSQVDNNPLTWGFDPYSGQFTCVVDGVYEVIIEGQVVGDTGVFIWPNGITSYGADLQADAGASCESFMPKVHTRFAETLGGNTNDGLTGESEYTSTFTERFIVNSSAGGTVTPRMFAFSYESPAATVECNMLISFMRVGGV